MLGLGWTEMLVIGVVALIVIGPKDLPVVMGRVGKVIGQIQRMGRDFQREINKTTGLDEVRNLRSSIANPLKKTADEIRREFNAIGADGQQKPTGILKPTDPKKESVVEAIQQQAGMSTTKPEPELAKSSTELAADYGFKPSAASENPAETAAPSAKAAPVKAVRPRPAKVATPTPATESTTIKPSVARKPRKKAVSAEVESVEPPATKPVTKPRSKRAKPADTAGKN